MKTLLSLGSTEAQRRLKGAHDVHTVIQIFNQIAFEPRFNGGSTEAQWNPWHPQRQSVWTVTKHSSEFENISETKQSDSKHFFPNWAGQCEKISWNHMLRATLRTYIHCIHTRTGTHGRRWWKTWLQCWRVELGLQRPATRTTGGRLSLHPTFILVL